MKRLESVSAFFPAYNDAATIASMVIATMLTLPKVSDDYEIIVVNDGSRDHTAEILEELARLYPCLRVITHEKNRGYGGALRTGFASAQKSWIFYTDGDAQYDPRELPRLADAVAADADVINGYKIARSDPLHRVLIGKLYHHIVRVLFNFRLRDVDCDYRLIKRNVFDHVELRSTSGTICLEMVKKFQDLGFRFKEVPVHHYHRAHGKSQFFNLRRLFATGAQLVQLWWKLTVKREHLRERARRLSSEPSR
jgi:glycosyltransferase involved in cell wall biosynthesis